MKKEPSKNERLVTREEQEAIDEIFSSINDVMGSVSPEFASKRLDREDYFGFTDFMLYFIKGGKKLCLDQQFSTADVLTITGLNQSQFKQWINREQIVLHTAKKAGSGKKAKYSITDLLIIFLGMALLNIRAPLNLANESAIRGLVLTRLKEFVEKNYRPGVCRIQLNFLPLKDAWKATYSISEESPDDDDRNRSAFIVINVDRLIYETLSAIGGFLFQKEIDQSPVLKEYFSTRIADRNLTPEVEKEITASPYLEAVLSFSEKDSNK